MKVLAIGAHPDDIEIFMYGFMAAAKARGDDVALIVATDGAAGNVAPGGVAVKGTSLASQRADETRLGLIGLGKPKLLDLPDGGLASDANAAPLVTKTITAEAPDLIITHAPEDYHPDHRALSAYVSDAAGFCCPVLFADTLMGVGFTPDYYVDITPHFDAKTNAIMEHHSQLPARFAEAARIMNRYRAAQCNAPDEHYAEAYRMDKRFPFADIRDMLPEAPPNHPFYVRSSNSLI
jgi:LmbE family N-acetylglucosaminyl deacetylase